MIKCDKNMKRQRKSYIDGLLLNMHSGKSAYHTGMAITQHYYVCRMSVDLIHYIMVNYIMVIISIFMKKYFSMCECHRSPVMTLSINSRSESHWAWHARQPSLQMIVGHMS